jgi:hypothetical protein
MLLCAAHAPLGGQCCDSCEETYRQRRHGLRLLPWFVIPLLLPFSYLIYNFGPLYGGRMHVYGGRQFTGHPFSDVFFVCLVFGVLAGGLVVALRLKLLRYRFVDEGVPSNSTENQMGPPSSADQG